MAGGEVAPRRPGRPKGSKNKRSAELGAYVAALYGGSAVQQMASVCMVTPAEVRRAGGVLQARLVKAAELAQHLGISKAAAWELMAKELAQLAPYTDKRQPQAIEATVDQVQPSVVFQIGGDQVAPLMPMDAEIVEVFGPADVQVSQPKSHDLALPFEIVGETDDAAAD